MTNPNDPRTKGTTGGALGGQPRTTPTPAQPPVLAPQGARAGQEVVCRACERIFTATPMPGDPAHTLCPHCQSVFRIDSLTPAAFDLQSGRTTLADLENPDLARDAQGRAVDVVGGTANDPLSLATSYADAAPHGIHYEPLPDGWRLSVPHYSHTRLLKAVAGLVGPVMIFLVFRQTFAGRTTAFPAFDWLFPAVLLLIALPSFRNLLSTLLGRTAMERHGEQITLRDGLWPSQQTQTFQWAQVQQLRAVDTTFKEEQSDADGDTRLVDVRHSFLQLLGPNLQVTFARDVYGANFWELRKFLQGEIDRQGHR